ncbi:MAG: tRNA (adenosine(37)-N6)-threonylcarbamoyltransferase complex ATPase subunit type 1 TsaE [Arcobacteraceae bacterium]|nr:tRNA (adenosine(37)-N6)-threonylcarbamoyltransferase complex ATPase subunit type 1 TsaE [Arcobacteraceae bacterium]
MNKFICNENQLGNFIDSLKKIILNKNIVVLLRGDLASGKTTLVKNYVKSLGILDKVTSPTFSLQSIYDNNIYHYDIYNKTLDEFIALGMLEEFEKDGIHFVEWGDKKLENILKEYGFNILVIYIKKIEDKREYRIGS